MLIKADKYRLNELREQVLKIDDFNGTVLKRVTDQFEVMAARTVTHAKLKEILEQKLNVKVEIDEGEC